MTLPLWKGLLIVVLLVAALSVGEAYDVLTVGEALNAALLFFLVWITSVYASETKKIATASNQQTVAARRQAEAARLDRYGNMHPVLSIAGFIQGTAYTSTEWFGAKDRIHTREILIWNFGHGPALNGTLTFHAGDEACHQHPLPTFGADRATMAVVDADVSRANHLSLDYQDVFGFHHSTTYELQFPEKEYFTIDREYHRCHYPQLDAI